MKNSELFAKYASKCGLTKSQLESVVNVAKVCFEGIYDADIGADYPLPENDVKSNKHLVDEYEVDQKASRLIKAGASDEEVVSTYPELTLEDVASIRKYGIRGF